MDQSEQGQGQLQQDQPVMGEIPVTNHHMPYTAPMVASRSSSASPTHPATTFSNSIHQLAYQQAQHFHQKLQRRQQLRMFWVDQLRGIERTSDFKNHSLPLARIKKVMKSDEDVRMISAEAPVVFAKACEVFIMELTLRSWIHTEESKRRTLQKTDIAAAISLTDVFDFLVDIIPKDELKEEGLGINKATAPWMGSPADMPYYYVQPQHPVRPHSMLLGKLANQGPVHASFQQPCPPMAFAPWLQPQPLQPQQQQQTQEQQTQEQEKSDS
ncbi:hypothetical protein SAY86_003952 [Trapa natans]|uniref:Core Histone H2A/H2B/H3 domain-containing protein n=1 Tax=Trapa natans TaxID=22666 RepID=A0AAN7MDM6_TRANT|nr:hypothetical protein SAY86_003952 [Trapa natans]